MKLRVGDEVVLIEDMLPYAKKGEIGIVEGLNSLVVQFLTDPPTNGDGRWWVNPEIVKKYNSITSPWED